MLRYVIHKIGLAAGLSKQSECEMLGGHRLQTGTHAALQEVNLVSRRTQETSS